MGGEPVIARAEPAGKERLRTLKGMPSSREDEPGLFRTESVRGPAPAGTPRRSAGNSKTRAGADNPIVRYTGAHKTLQGSQPYERPPRPRRRGPRNRSDPHPSEGETANRAAHLGRSILPGPLPTVVPATRGKATKLERERRCGDTAAGRAPIDTLKATPPVDTQHRG
jgi:hypothetical protein